MERGGVDARAARSTVFLSWRVYWAVPKEVPLHPTAWMAPKFIPSPWEKKHSESYGRWLSKRGCGQLFHLELFGKYSSENFWCQCHANAVPTPMPSWHHLSPTFFSQAELEWASRKEVKSNTLQTLPLYPSHGGGQEKVPHQHLPPKLSSPALLPEGSEETPSKRQGLRLRTMSLHTWPKDHQRQQTELIRASTEGPFPEKPRVPNRAAGAVWDIFFFTGSPQEKPQNREGKRGARSRAGNEKLFGYTCRYPVLQLVQAASKLCCIHQRQEGFPSALSGNLREGRKRET